MSISPQYPQLPRSARALILLLLLSAVAHRETATAQTVGRQPAAQAPAAVRTEPLDLNTASAADLRALPGMGDAYVRRILDGRPYAAKNQLVTRGILPQAAYSRIRDLIVAHRPLHP